MAHRAAKEARGTALTGPCVKVRSQAGNDPGPGCGPLGTGAELQAPSSQQPPQLAAAVPSPLPEHGLSLLDASRGAGVSSHQTPGYDEGQVSAGVGQSVGPAGENQRSQHRKWRIGSADLRDTCDSGSSECYRGRL